MVFDKTMYYIIIIKIIDTIYKMNLKNMKLKFKHLICKIW